MIQNKKQMFALIGSFILVILLGTVTYAFFNYTRTGTANNLRTGRIYFDASQSDTVTLSDLFPITVSGEVTDQTPGVGSLSIHVTGDTNYESGVEYIVKAVNVTGSNGTNLPISISIGYEATTGEGNTIGTEDEDYFTNRGGNTSRYKILSNDTIEEGKELVVGYIAPGETGIDGNIIIMAYLDARNIAITDTIEDGAIEVPGYENGTDTNWINGRTVFTTEEWNALQSSGVSFQVKVEANEGTWVDEPTVPTAADVIGALDGLENAGGAKRYVGANPNNYVIFNDETWRIIGVYGDQLKIIKPESVYNGRYSLSNTATSWGDSIISDYLENTYYPTLSITARNMVDENATWYIGGSLQDATASVAYTNSQTSSVTGKIGVMASYEYLYAAENDGTCWSTAGSSYGNGCAQKDWMNFPRIAYLWTMTNHSNYSSAFLDIGSAGNVDANYVTAERNVYPIVYLNPGVVITGGTGEPGGNEYILSYTAS